MTEEPVYYGPDVDAALDWVVGFAATRDALERALERLRSTLASHGPLIVESASSETRGPQPPAPTPEEE